MCLYYEEILKDMFYLNKTFPYKDVNFLKRDRLTGICLIIMCIKSAPYLHQKSAYIALNMVLF